ncbi:MAG: sugar phosphate isomerase/epimerase [Lachnospiraceae bacterium]|nr:sugar phosphate isomerase/epimerase [Lachnospiraceae bacterium]
MQLGIRLHDTENMPFESRIANVHTQGFTCAHLAISKLLPEIPKDPGALTPGLAMYMKNIFAQNHVEVAVLGCYLNLATPDQAALEANLEKYKAHIRFASLLGAGVVGTETGAPNTTYTTCPECRSEEALQTFIKNLRPVVSYAEKMGVIFAIEPVAKHIVYDAKRARKVLDEIASPNLQIIFDPVNLLSVENYVNQDEIIAEAIELLGKDVAVVHLKDFIPENGDLQAVAAGKGQMDYTRALQFIKTCKPYIHTTLENTAPDNAVWARECLEKLYNQL